MPLIMSMSMIRYGHDSFHDFFWIVLFFQARVYWYPHIRIGDFHDRIATRRAPANTMQGVDAPPALNPNPDLLQLAVPDQQQDPFHCDELFFQIGLVNIGHKKVE